MTDDRSLKARAEELVAQMTLEEKAGLCSGLDCWHTKPVERLSVPSIAVADGPHGLRKQIGVTDNLGIGDSVPAVCFPTASALACSFDRDLVYSVGKAMGEECVQEGVSVILGPGANMKRSPLCGRSFEYYSEDPKVSGELAASMICGIQSTGTGASLKHFAVNNQEKRRMTIDAVLDERTLRETYLRAFEIAVKKGRPDTVMSAYNRINGAYCGENEKLLTGILREEWDFDGLVVSDWNSVDNRAAGALAGLDLEMPGSNGINDKKLVAAVKSGALPEAALNRAARKVTELALRGAANRREGFQYDADAHHRLAVDAAAQCAVLLKNDSGLLPGNTAQQAAVIGAFAKTPRYQGAGSSKINPIRVDAPWDALKKLGLDAAYAPGYSLNVKDRADEDTLIREACDAARGRDIVYVFVGLTEGYESEGFDRSSLAIPPAHNRLIEAVSAVNPNVAVILLGGAPMELPWLSGVKAVLLPYLGGEGMGSAVARLLLGLECPGGKLAETWPLRLEDVPCHWYFPGGRQTVEYRESVYVGYRYYDTAQKPVLFPFGHGLSYAAFAYEGIELDRDTCRLGDEIRLSFSVANRGGVEAKETAFIFTAQGSSRVFRPVKELREFVKVSLKPGETKRVTVSLDTQDFGYWNTMTGGWYAESGEYRILVGSSSRDIALEAVVRLESPDQPQPDFRETAPVYYRLPKGELEISDREFEALLGRSRPAHDEEPKKPYGMHNSLDDIRHTLIGRLMLVYATATVKKMSRKEPGQEGMMLATVKEMPFFAMVTSGELSESMVQGIVDMANGHYVRGIRKLFG
jgi:beta-glucosidase